MIMETPSHDIPIVFIGILPIVVIPIYKGVPLWKRPSPPSHRMLALRQQRQVRLSAPVAGES